MRSALSALRPAVTKIAQEAREKLATAAFNLEAVKLAIIEAAARGELALKITLKESVWLRDTKAADELAAWVLQHKMQIEWEVRQAERESGLKATIAEPLISWGEEAHG